MGSILLTALELHWVPLAQTKPLLVIAPNQDFVLSSVPRREAGAAGGALNAAQRVGAAMGRRRQATASSGRGSSR